MTRITRIITNKICALIVLIIACSCNNSIKNEPEAIIRVRHSKDRIRLKATEEYPFIRDYSTNDSSILFSFGGAPLNKDSVVLMIGDSVLYQNLPINDQVRKTVLFLRKGEDLFRLKIAGKEQIIFDVPQYYDHVNVFHDGHEVYVLYCYNPECK